MVAMYHLDTGAQRARISQHHAAPGTSSQTGIIGRVDPRAMRGFSDQRGRQGIGPFPAFQAVREPPAIGRKSGEPDRQNPAR